MSLFKFYGKPGLLLLLLMIVLISVSCVSLPMSKGINAESVSEITVPSSFFTYELINTYPHERNAFTQGLVFENGALYEGAGLYEKSSLRKVDIETGQVLQIYELPAQYFGEGITVYKDKVIQLTWKNNKGFIYDKDKFDLLSEFTYLTEGWGITHDGNRLIMSDGTSFLYFLDPETLEITGSVKINNNGAPLDKINELEYVNGRVLANIWQTDKIAIINPQNGNTGGWIDLTGLLQTQDYFGSVDVLNGIAYDSAEDRLFVTGKLWPFLFEIKLVPEYTLN